jgi:hypothetical protein
VEAALRLFDDIRRVASDPAARAQILPLVQRLGLRIGLGGGAACAQRLQSAGWEGRGTDPYSGPWR